MGFLKRLLGGKESKFQQQVLGVLQQHYPGIGIEAGADPLLVRLNGVDLELGKLHQVCEQNQTQADEFIRQYFSYPAALCAKAGSVDQSEVELRVRPQLAPAGFAERFGVVTFPFVPGIHAALVLRGESEEPYLRKEDLAAWGLDAAKLYEKSLLNLNSDQAEMEVTITDGTDRFIGMESHDGFDAARILLPRVRRFAAGKLGASYLGGMPNRNFLILWSKDCSQRFQDYAVEKIETDYAIQPFPLSSSRYEVSESAVHEL